MKLANLDRRQTAYLQVLMMLVIFVHNFFIAMPWHLPISEFQFNPHALGAFWHALQNHPSSFLESICVYIGFNAVQVFVILSAYGLAKRSVEKPTPYWAFIWRRISVLYPPLIVMVALLCILYPASKSVPILMALTTLNIWLPHQALNPVGPWWFLYMIVEFYFILPFLLKVYQCYGDALLIAFVIVQLLLEFCLNPLLLKYGVNLNHSFLGYLMAISFGLWWAAKGECRVPWWACLIGLVLLILGNLSAWIWPFVGFVWGVLFLALGQQLSGFLQKFSIGRSALNALVPYIVTVFIAHGYTRLAALGLLSCGTATWQLWAYFCVYVVFTAVVVGLLNYGLEKK